MIISEFSVLCRKTLMHLEESWVKADDIVELFMSSYGN